MLARLLNYLRRLLKVAIYGLTGMALMLLIVFVVYLNGRADLEAWHLVDLDEEFTADSRVETFAEYLDLEDRLFQQLDEQVYAGANTPPGDRINRFKRGSLSDPERWSPNWNRSFLMVNDVPRASVLLLHGLSDSPYSLNSLAKELNAAGANVLGLRIPGHGTAPSGLVTVSWQDMAAAVRLAVLHLAQQYPDQPVYVIGYSNGAALAVHYAVSSLNDPELPRTDRLVLISPEIGVTPAAALAVWQARLGHLLGLDKLAWNVILPEYDPFKYGSFAVNAGDVSHRLTAEIQSGISQLEAHNKLDEIPPVLAFSSVVDATVSVPALIDNLFNRLPERGHDLVLFDINVRAGIETFLRWSPDVMLGALTRSDHPGFSLSLLSNRNSADGSLIERRWKPGQKVPVELELNLHWPHGVYSLTHVALPFSPDDPLYGGNPAQPSPGIRLGDIALRGERDVLKISPAEMLRLRWNPFYPYLRDRTLRFLQLERNPGDMDKN